MLKLRLKKFGRKKLPSYRVVLMESCSRRDGKPIREVGFYNPINNQIKLNTDEILTSLKNGAKPTKTVFNLLVKAKMLETKS
jgi:small subunit ribosomal protein S16|uniref:Small ribosomal subunit protein bS16c n=2 Tax=Heterosigma akashiwo TaxID=2829 RepID=B2XT49_HETAK|nr:30S ribosomal protein S16 [Heterosigma akashiwo]ABV65947.1 30S ribosomal protein S16 [Heterosigma akashiwo]ABV70088.1 30S ribosomal protein S16 [Heterosigma akashiwo]BBA18160.1 30S ribosomal protein S1 [Heterosigma akashiwo]BBA18299.1 30S ribosomal protein S1 [Heterosigma akashiwo]BBA18438.1 30S ribosomal protein S1 [Heterosigma akashiwo]|mmetsp:Transcript_47724/g.69782  ORF Transcript_47724/g.69782 Transcript_47724/m.69782 type:complete len:82 (+) Transcript_47724:110-355(+)